MNFTHDNLDKKGFLSLRKDKDGFVYGEWSSVGRERESSGRQEIHEKSRLAIVDGITDVGGENSKYQVNEDSIFAIFFQERVILGVIDGAGGSKEGLLASRLANSGFIDSFQKGESLKQAVERADFIVCKKGKGGYAAGVVAEIILEGTEKTVKIALLGDCKALTLRDGRKFAPGTTKFQNLAQEAIEKGKIREDEYYNYENLNILKGAFGQHGEKGLAPQFLEFSANKNDRIVLGSDGVWDVVSEYEVQELSKTHQSNRDFQEALFQLAYQRNNSTKPFYIQHSSDIRVKKQPFF